MPQYYVHRISPISSKGFFDVITKNALKLSKLIAGLPIFENVKPQLSEKREWHPEDRIVPPNCGYTDIYEETWENQSYKLVNFRRQHSSDPRLMDSGGYAFMSLWVENKLLFSINACKDSLQGFQEIQLSNYKETDEETILNEFIAVLGILNFAEPFTENHNENNRKNSSQTSTSQLTIAKQYKEHFFSKIALNLPLIIHKILEISDFSIDSDAIQQNHVTNGKIERLHIHKGNYDCLIEVNYQPNNNEFWSGKFVFSKQDEPIFSVSVIEPEANSFTKVDIIQLAVDSQSHPLSPDAIQKRRQTLKDLFEKTDEQITFDFIRLVQLHHVTERSIAFYGDKLNLSTLFLNEIFQMVKGEKSIDFIERQLVNSVKLQLIHSGDSIENIAAQFGFQNPQKFMDYFIKQVGFSPMTFRHINNK